MSDTAKDHRALVATLLRLPDILLSRMQIERWALLLRHETAGKLTVELNMKNGRWAIGNVTVTFPTNRETP